MTAAELIARAVIWRQWAAEWRAVGCNAKALELRTRAAAAEQRARGMQ